MATIALSANRINQMPSMIKQVKQSVADYKSELFAIKMQTFTINQSICNLSEVVDSIQASTQTQEDKIDSLENMLRESEEFISDVVRIDDKAADAINHRRDEFYEDYYYLKPDCEKSWTDKARDFLVSAAEWCKENWKSLVKIAVTIVIVAALGALSVLTGGALAVILGAAFWGALSGALFGGAISGLTSLFSGGSFLEGFADGALSGAITGAIIGAAGAGGSIVGSILGGSCKYAASAGKILKAFKYTSKISGILSFGMGAFDTAAMIAGFFNPDSFLAKLNRDLHANSLYNAFQIGVTITAVFTGAAYASMRERMKFPPTCFIAGTLILTAFGLVAIENIKVGDKVIATNPDTFEQAEKTVVETYVNETRQLIRLTIQGETITTTWNHPFYVEGKGFVPAGELQVGDKTLGVDGESYAIETYQEEIVETPETVYNFQVEDYHTYYVGCAGVLVHNADCGKRVQKVNRDQNERIDLPEYDGKTTHGVLLLEDGTQMSFSSGNPNPNYKNYIPASHVEGKAAICMRENGIKNGTIYHNNTDGTCPYCDKMLSTLLEEGTTLTVVPPSNASAPKPSWIDTIKTYVGNDKVPQKPK